MKKIITLLTLLTLLCTPMLYAQAEEITVEPSLAPSGIAEIDGVFYFADSFQRVIWRYENGTAEVLAGQTTIVESSGRQLGGYYDAPLSQASFQEPWAIVPYQDGLLVSDRGNHVLRYLDLDAQLVTTLAGTTTAGYEDGKNAAFDSPTGLAVGSDGTVYIADTGNNVIRALAPDGTVSTYAGGEEGCALGTLDEARFSAPTGLCYAGEVLYVADSGNHRIVAIENGQVSLVAGATLDGDAAYEGAYLDGAAAQACFANPQGVAVSEDGTIYIADTGNGAVRMLQDGTVSTLLAMDSLGTGPVAPRGLMVKDDVLYIGDVFSRLLIQMPVK